MSLEQIEEYKYQGLYRRALQSIDEREHLQFLGSSKSDFILFLRFKFGLSEMEAGRVFDRLQADRAVTVDVDDNVRVNHEMVRRLIEVGK